MLRPGQGDVEASARAYLTGGLDRLLLVQGSHHERDRSELAFARWADEVGPELPSLVARWVQLACAVAMIPRQNADPRG